jgi:hypothetical protein
MRNQRTWTRAAIVLATAGALAACESENALDTNLITFTSLSDQFSFSVNGLDNVTGGVQYFWPMTGTQADVDVTQGISSGTAIIQIRDGAGVVRYQEDARDEVDSTTVAGAQGFWQVSVVLTKVTGEFSFVVSRHDTLSSP